MRGGGYRYCTYITVYSTVLYILIFSKHYNVTTFPRLIQQFPQASGCPKCKAAFSLVEAGTVIP